MALLAIGAVIEAWHDRKKPGHEDALIYTWLAALLLAAIIVFALVAGGGHAQARDLDGRYAQQDPKLHEWFEGLRSGKGPCCSDADGSAISDADWETQNKPNSHYRVRLDVSRVPDKVTMEWVDVPDEAVITEPNRVGKTMVWPIKGYLGISVRCFMPGIMG